VTQLSTFPGKVTTGDYSKDSDPRISSWVISDLSGGHGVADIREGVDQGRCRWATLNTRYPGQFAPPYTATTEAGPNTDGARPLGDGYLASTGDYRFYAAFGTALCRFSHITLAFSSSLGTDGHLYRTTDGTTWTDWGDDSPLAVVDPTLTPRNLVTYYDQGGNQTIFVVTNRGALSFDPNGPRLYAVEALDWPPHPYQALGSAKWRSHLYVTIGMGARRYTGDIAQPMGLDRDEGLPATYRGRCLDLEPESNGLYALCVGGESGATSWPSLHVWTDFGWHTVWAETTAAQTTSKATWARVSEAQGNHTLWWGDGSGGLRRMDLPVDDANPRAQLLGGGGNFEQSTKSLIQTGRFDAGMAGIDKIASHLYV
jgi:hypothetical protein